jgi:hypothetical protein
MESLGKPNCYSWKDSFTAGAQGRVKGFTDERRLRCDHCRVWCIDADLHAHARQEHPPEQDSKRSFVTAFRGEHNRTSTCQVRGKNGCIWLGVHDGRLPFGLEVFG